MTTTLLNKNPFNILLVEDNTSEAMLARLAIGEAGMDCNLKRVCDGDEAMEYLRREKGYEDALHPDLILLDLKMPRKNGKETLAEIKADDLLRTIPVIILSSSADEKDIVDCYRDYANSYIVKPMNYDIFVKIMRELLMYWNGVSLIP